MIDALDQLEPARPPEQLALRLPVQAIYKFDDRRIVAGRIESGNLASGDEIVIMPAGKIAKIKSVESWPVTPLQGAQTAGRSVGITLDRELFIERGDVIAHTGSVPRETRRIHARIFWLHDKPLGKGEQILVRLGTRESRASVVAIEKAVDPGELASVETQSIARNHVGEIDIALAQPIAADRLRRQSQDRASRHRGQRTYCRRRAGAVGRCRTTRGSDRYRAGGIGLASG